MCHYITAALPAGVDLKSLKPILKAHRQVLRPAENRFVQEQLPAGAQYLSCTSKHCDCGTALGWLHLQDERTAPPGDEAKLRRKGWSEARIQRWSAERARAEEKVERAVAAGTPHEEAERWAAFLRAVLKWGEAEWFGLLLHWYRGDAETERIHFADTVQVASAEVDADSILRLREDVFYRFTR